MHADDRQDEKTFLFLYAHCREDLILKHSCMEYPVFGVARSLSDLGNRGENSAGRGQILSILQVNSRSIDQESGEIWSVQTDLQ